MSTTNISRSIPLSPSPSSPPTKDGGFIRHQGPSPKTPISPQLMSVSTQSYASSLGRTHTSPTEAAPQSQPRSSPPSSSSAMMSGSPQRHNSESNNVTNPFPTPADSAYNPSSISESGVSNERKRKREDDEQNPSSPKSRGRMEVDEVSKDLGSGQADEATAKLADNDQEMASEEVTLEQIQKDMGEAFLLCRTTLHASRPNPSEHLLSRYGLTPLVATVARTDPKTGEKINKLRKSYEGQMKIAGLAGKNKPDKRDDRPLLTMLEWPAQEWHAQKVASKKIEMTADFRTKIHQAMKMEPGPVRNQAEWDSIMGHEKPLRPPLPTELKREASAPASSSRPGYGIPIGQQRPQAPPHTQSELNRPRRAGKKRSYDDNSFAGYGEGFVDDDGDAMYSSDEGGTGGRGRKKRKKASLDASSSGIAPD